MSPKAYKIALVAGEASSDMIGASLIHDIIDIQSNTEIIAVGGKQIKATGVNVIQDNEVFSIMGLVEVLKDLPKLLKIKKQIVNDILAFKPDVFIGIDSPDLNFSIAKSMKKKGIPVMHYVSPSVWAWRPKRIFKMARFIDGLMTLFPFEVDIYKPTRIKAQFVGHPLAKKIPVNVDKTEAKKAIYSGDKKIIALLPGSRNREIKTLVPIFIDTIKRFNNEEEWQIMSSNVSPEKIHLVNSLASEQQISIQWVDDATTLLKAADFALLGSGTVALEALLCRTPMVVSYKISALTWFVVNTFNMMKLPYYSLPNVLHQGFLVPEVMQKELSVNNLAEACRDVIEQVDQQQLLNEFEKIHKSLIPKHANQAAKTALQFLEGI